MSPSVFPELLVEYKPSRNISFTISTLPHPLLSYITSDEYWFYFVLIFYPHINELMIAWRSYATNEFVIWLCIMLNPHRIHIPIIFHTFVNESINIHICYLSCREMHISRVITITRWSWSKLIKHSKSIVFNEMFFYCCFSRSTLSKNK